MMILVVLMGVSGGMGKARSVMRDPRKPDGEMGDAEFGKLVGSGK
jgi:hypothetical protein